MPIQPREGCVGHLLTGLAMLVVFHLGGAGCLTMLLVNDAHHMTVARATTPRLPTRFRVLDAESAQPVVGAQIVAMHNFDWMSDWFIDGTTGADGMATLRLAKNYLHLLSVHVYADGYLDRHYLSLGGSPGAGALTDDPIDILVYRAPAAGVGWRFPPGFSGEVSIGKTQWTQPDATVIVGGEASDEPFQSPPAFPAGKRIWWSDLTPQRENRVAAPPRLGDAGGDIRPHAYPIPEAVIVGEREIPIPEPGAAVAGPALWQIGTRQSQGPWGATDVIFIVGDRDAALARAAELWRLHRNGETGYILNGWLREVAPNVAIVDPQPYAVTRDPVAK